MKMHFQLYNKVLLRHFCYDTASVNLKQFFLTMLMIVPYIFGRTFDLYILQRNK
jgi:hypothetical protein